MPPAYEVLLLNTTVPQIQAAQSGDTYVVPRDIAFSAALTLSAGTANGVPYLNGSKVLTTGSALSFDGTKLTSGAFGNTGRRLEVNGSEVLFDGAGQFDLLMGDGGVAYMSLTTTDNATGLKIRNYSGNSDIAVFERTTGNVGIGTTSPGYKLDVVGALNLQGSSTFPTTGMFLRSADNQLKIIGGSAGISFAAQSGASTYAVIDASGNLKLGGTANRATTAGTNHFDIFDGTAPVGTLANGISIYSSAGEAYVMDAAGNATLFSPHDAATNEWIFRSKHTPTGKVLKIDVERLLKFVNDHFGLDAVHEFIED